MGSAIFECASVEDAMGIILTPEVGLSTDQRWEQETAWLIERLDFADGGLLVDYGCGIGRMAKALVDRKSAHVIGVDQSASMRVMATGYVGRDDRFQAVAPSLFNRLVDNGLLIDGALTAWCLQHIPMPELDTVLAILWRALRFGGALWTLERPERYLPVHGPRWGWTTDGVSVAERLAHHGFVSVSREAVPERLCAPGAELSQWRIIMSDQPKPDDQPRDPPPPPPPPAEPHQPQAERAPVTHVIDEVIRIGGTGSAG